MFFLHEFIFICFFLSHPLLPCPSWKEEQLCPSPCSAAGSHGVLAQSWPEDGLSEQSSTGDTAGMWQVPAQIPGTSHR